MNTIRNTFYEGERALFASRNISLENVKFTQENQH